MKKTILIFLYILFAFAAIAEVGVEKEGDIVSIQLLKEGKIVEGESMPYNAGLDAKFAADENGCIYVLFPSTGIIYKYDVNGKFIGKIIISYKDMSMIGDKIYTYNKKLYIYFWKDDFRGILITDLSGVFKDVYELDKLYNASDIFFKDGCFFDDSSRVIWSEEADCNKMDTFKKHEINYDNLESKKTITVNPAGLVLQLPNTGFDYFDARILDADNGEYKILITAKDENVYYESVHGNRFPGNTHWMLGYKNEKLLYNVKLETEALYPKLYFSNNSIYQLWFLMEDKILVYKITKWNIIK